MYIVSRLSYAFTESKIDNHRSMNDIMFLSAIMLTCFVFLVIHVIGDVQASIYSEHRPALTLFKLIGLTLGASMALVFLIVWRVNWKNIRTHI